MDRFFRQDSPIMQSLNRMADLIILNILWLLCCIPIITIGASTAALYRNTLDKTLKIEQTSILKRFLAAFRTNLKPATLVWLIFILPELSVIALIWMLIIGTMQASIGILIFCLILLAILLAVVPYTFAYIAMFEDKPLVCIKNAILIAIINLPRTVGVVLVNCIPYVLLFLAPQLFFRTSILWLLFGFSLIALLSARLIIKAFAPFIPKEDAENASHVEAVSQ